MKKLYRSKDDKLLGGVCGGIGEYFNIDPTLVRIALGLLVVITLGAALPGIVIIYAVAWLLVPEESEGVAAQSIAPEPTLSVGPEMTATQKKTAKPKQKKTAKPKKR